MSDLIGDLQTALGESYRIERELSGGGMSRVFLAEETALSRPVVIKVLPTEMAAGVSAERFRREIQLAANLQHPHVVPLLTAGSAGDLLYYVMPFIKGESLRAKLEREGELPIDEVVHLLRDVADALGYAFHNAILGHGAAGDLVAMDTLLALFAERFPDHVRLANYRVHLALAQRDFVGAAAHSRELLDGPPGARQAGYERLHEIAHLHGRLDEATRQRRAALAIAAERGGWSDEERAVWTELDALERAVWFAEDPTAYTDRLERLWANRRALDAAPLTAQRRDTRIIVAFARAGLAARARALHDEYAAAAGDPRQLNPVHRASYAFSDGVVALAEGRVADAIDRYRGACAAWLDAYSTCRALPLLAEAFDAAGQADSALATYERYVALRAWADPEGFAAERWWYAPAHRRLAELYEAKGERARALEYYARFVDLWREADPQLQPLVRDAERRIQELAGEAPLPR